MIDGFAKHPTVKLLKAVVHEILDEVPADPASPLFEQGNTLGEAHRHCSRAIACFFDSRLCSPRLSSPG